MIEVNSVAFKEAVKEVVRLAVLGVVSWAITWATNQNTEVFVTVAVVLRGIDKWIHENPSRFNGLLPF